MVEKEKEIQQKTLRPIWLYAIQPKIKTFYQKDLERKKLVCHIHESIKKGQPYLKRSTTEAVILFRTIIKRVFKEEIILWIMFTTTRCRSFLLSNYFYHSKTGQATNMASIAMLFSSALLVLCIFKNITLAIYYLILKDRYGCASKHLGAVTINLEARKKDIDIASMFDAKKMLAWHNSLSHYAMCISPCPSILVAAS